LCRLRDRHGLDSDRCDVVRCRLARISDSRFIARVSSLMTLAARLFSRIFPRGKPCDEEARDRSIEPPRAWLNEGKKLSVSRIQTDVHLDACSRTMIDKRCREKGKAALRQKRESFGATVGLTENAAVRRDAIPSLSPLRLAFNQRP